MVSTAGAVGAKGGWVTPNCVVEANDGLLTIPVVNVNPHSIGRKSAKDVLKAVPVRESEIYPFDSEASVVTNFQGDEDPANCITLDNVKIDGNLTPEQVKELRALLTGHRRGFLAKKEKLTSRNTTSIQEMQNLYTPYPIAYRWRSANL